MAPKTALTVTVRITGLRETIRAFKNLPDDATKELRAASLSIAGVVAVEAKQAAQTNAQSALMAPTVKAVRDRVPAVEAGGTRRVGSNRVPAFKVLFGSEFGSKALKQFRPFTDTYWFFGTVENNRAFIDREWNEAADEILRKWAT